MASSRHRKMQNSKIFQGLCPLVPTRSLPWTRWGGGLRHPNDLLSISELTKHKNVILFESIDREVRYFNIQNGHGDGLHLNRKVGCKALSGFTLKTIYANLRPHCKKSKSNRPKHKPH